MTDQTTPMKQEEMEREYSVTNPSYDQSVPFDKRLRDFLGKYHVVLNGVVAHDPYIKHKDDGGGMCCQDHKEEIVEFVGLLISQLLLQKEQEVREEEWSKGWIVGVETGMNYFDESGVSGTMVPNTNMTIKQKIDDLKKRSSLK